MSASILGSTSDRSAVALTTFEDRMYAAACRRANAKARLLDTLLALNHECVHPQNSYYVPSLEGSGATNVYLWAASQGLLTDSDRRAYHGF